MCKTSGLFLCLVAVCADSRRSRSTVQHTSSFGKATEKPRVTSTLKPVALMLSAAKLPHAFRPASPCRFYPKASKARSGLVGLVDDIEPAASRRNKYGTLRSLNVEVDDSETKPLPANALQDGLTPDEDADDDTSFLAGYAPDEIFTDTGDDIVTEKMMKDNALRNLIDNVKSEPNPYKRDLDSDRVGQVLEFIYILFAFVVVRAVALEPFRIPSLSMFPTLDIGDQILCEKVTRLWRPSNRGEIVLFTKPPNYIPVGLFETGASSAGDAILVKRVVAVGRDTVEVREGKLYVNDELQKDKYINFDDPPTYTLEKQKVPPDSVFVLGDNRMQSNDSSRWGFLPKANIIGKAWWLYSPQEKWGSLDPQD